MLHTASSPLLSNVARAALIALGLATPAFADDWAVDGMDVVELFRGAEVAGRPDVALRWHGKIWLFEAERNRNLFEADPRAFAPALNGLCPVALSEGRRVRGRADLAVVVSGRLYLPSTEAAQAMLLARGADVVQDAPAHSKTKKNTVAARSAESPSADTGEVSSPAQTDAITDEASQ